MSDRYPALIDEMPVMFYPSMAKYLGINKAIMVHQLSMLLIYEERLGNEDRFFEGHWWIPNTSGGWQVWFPWLSEDAIQRLWADLERDGLVLSRYTTGKKRWFTVDNIALHQFILSIGGVEVIPQNRGIDSGKLPESQEEEKEEEKESSKEREEEKEEELKEDDPPKNAAGASLEEITPITRPVVSSSEFVPGVKGITGRKSGGQDGEKITRSSGTPLEVLILEICNQKEVAKTHHDKLNREYQVIGMVGGGKQLRRWDSLEKQFTLRPVVLKQWLEDLSAWVQQKQGRLTVAGLVSAAVNYDYNHYGLFDWLRREKDIDLRTTQEPKFILSGDDLKRFNAEQERKLLNG